MMHAKWIAPLAALGALCVATAVAHADDAHDLVKRVADATPQTAFTAKATLTSDRGWTRELALSHKRVKDVDAAYMEVTAPMDLKDTRFLLLDHVVGKDEQFIYVPQIKRTIQVGGQTRKQEFLGSDFYVADMVRPELDAYTYTFAGDEDVGGRHCKLVQSVPKNPTDELYSKTILAVDPTDLLIVRTQLFDPDGKLVKVWTLEKVEKIDGNWTPMVQKMESVQSNHWSKLDLNEVKYNAALSDDIFTRSYLAR